jgi:hypothetical protein
MSPDGNASGVTLTQLQNELHSDHSTDDGIRRAPDQGAEAILNRVRTQLDSPGYQFDEAAVKSTLAELLVALVDCCDQDTNGKRLMDDLATVFDTRLSPGTVYPQLHSLEDLGLLRSQELVRTKEYQIADTDVAYSLIETAMLRHQVLGLFFEGALESFDDS